MHTLNRGLGRLGGPAATGHRIDRKAETFMARSDYLIEKLNVTVRTNDRGTPLSSTGSYRH